MIFFLWAENEGRWSLSKNEWKYGIFCICVGDYKHDIAPRQKAKMPLPRKNTPKGDISGITEKDDIDPRKYSISAETPRWLTP